MMALMCSYPPLLAGANIGANIVAVSKDSTPPTATTFLISSRQEEKIAFRGRTIRDWNKLSLLSLCKIIQTISSSAQSRLLKAAEKGLCIPRLTSSL